MRRFAPLTILWATLFGEAIAGESETQDLRFEDHWDVFENLEFDTGPLPANSKLAIRAWLESTGDYSARINAESNLWWPDTLSHSVTGVFEGGRMALETSLTLHVELIIDLSNLGFGVYEIQVIEQSIDLYEDEEFDGLLMSDSSPYVVDLSTEGTTLGPFRYDVAIFTGVNLRFRASVWPTAELRLEGLRVETESSDGEYRSYNEERDVGEFALPQDPRALHLESTWVGQLDGGLGVVIHPDAGVCTPIGCLSPIQFDIPIELLDIDRERRFGTATYTHPLPMLDMDAAAHDFGAVTVGTDANYELPLYNLGAELLVGEVEVQGDSAFHVFPDHLHAPEEDYDGIVVTFSPETVGDTSAIIVLHTNDPSRPTVEVEVRGKGVERDGVGGRVGVESGCGCATQGGLSPVFLLLPPLLLRRRQAQRQRQP